MTRNRILLAGLFVAGLIVGVGSLAFSSSLVTLDLHPDRHLMARDEVALAYSVALLEMHESRMERHGFNIPKLEGSEKTDSDSYIQRFNDELARTSYALANAFLRQKVAMQEQYIADMDKSGRFAGLREHQYIQEVYESLGNPNSYRDRSGNIQDKGFAPPFTPTPDPNQ